MGVTIKRKNVKNPQSALRNPKADIDQEPQQTSDHDHIVENSDIKPLDGNSSHIADDFDMPSRAEADFPDIADGRISINKRKYRKRSCKDDSKVTSNIPQSKESTDEKPFDTVVKDNMFAPEVTGSSLVDGNDSNETTSDTDPNPDDMEITDTIGYSAGNEDDGAAENNREAHVDRSGVIFCSRIPPFMSLSKLRSYFSRYAKIGRIYAEPETINDYKRRVKMGGNKKLKFIHGWIEFLDKAIAKRVAAQLNGQPVGEKKRHNFWRDDLWNLLYLPRYKFNDVMAYLREHKNDRKEKLSFHLANSRKDNYNYMEQLEAEKQHKAIEKRRKKQGLPAFKHQARIRSKEIPQKHDDDDHEDSEQSVPMGLLGAIVT